MELFTRKVDGSDVKRITHNSYWEHQPDVSPDGRKIVCCIHYSPGRVDEKDPGWEIAVMDIDGSKLTRLTDNAYLDSGPHWNSDGTKIVYVSDSAHRASKEVDKRNLPQYDIYTMNADGSGRTKLTSAKPGDINADPSFSFSEPSRILYIHSEGLSGGFDLCMMDADGSNKKLVLPHDERLLAINDPMFSPDGKTIIFCAKVGVTRDGRPLHNLFTVDENGGDLRRITRDDGEADVVPQFSPDGSKICYFTYEWEGDGHTERIRIANPDGSDETTISDFPWEYHPSWVDQRRVRNQ
jgi:TolB protein